MIVSYDYGNLYYFLFIPMHGYFFIFYSLLALEECLQKYIDLGQTQKLTGTFKMGAFRRTGAILLVMISFVQQVYAKPKHINFESKIEEKRGCDLYQGTWVFDVHHPHYNSADCPFIEKQFSCQKNGRPDNYYLKYSWKPTACELPMFNGESFLRRFRTKRILFVGDSLSLNQWQSLTCLLHKAVPEANYTISRTGDLSTFRFPAYDLSVMISRNAYLVDITQEKNGRVLNLDSITTNGNLWKGIDVLIFDTWHWWLHTDRKQPWDFVRFGKKTSKDIDRFVAYEKALQTWGRWVEANVDPTKTKVFFQGVSPDHSNPSEWGQQIANTCNGEMLPLHLANYPGGRPQAQVILENVLQKMSKPVHLLNVTALSQLRKDGHPAGFGLVGRRGTDCTHWCLPGVPDTWNQLLYAALSQN